MIVLVECESGFSLAFSVPVTDCTTTTSAQYAQEQDQPPCFMYALVLTTSLFSRMLSTLIISQTTTTQQHSHNKPLPATATPHHRDQIPSPKVPSASTSTTCTCTTTTQPQYQYQIRIKTKTNATKTNKEITISSVTFTLS